MYYVKLNMTNLAITNYSLFYMKIFMSRKFFLILRYGRSRATK